MCERIASHLNSRYVQTYTCCLLVLPTSQLKFSTHTYILHCYVCMYITNCIWYSSLSDLRTFETFGENIYPTSILCSGKVQPTPDPPSPDPYDQLESRNSRMKNRPRGVQNKKAAPKYLFHLFVHTNTHIIQSR